MDSSVSVTPSTAPPALDAASPVVSTSAAGATPFQSTSFEKVDGELVPVSAGAPDEAGASGEVCAMRYVLSVDSIMALETSENLTGLGSPTAQIGATVSYAASLAEPEAEAATSLAAGRARREGRGMRRARPTEVTLRDSGQMWLPIGGDDPAAPSRQSKRPHSVSPPPRLESSADNPMDNHFADAFADDLFGGAMPWLTNATPRLKSPTFRAAAAPRAADDEAGKPPKMWTPLEDGLIMSGVRTSGFRWSLIAQRLPGRSGNAVRNRYHRLEKAEAQRRAARESGRKIEGYKCRKCGQYKRGHICGTKSEVDAALAAPTAAPDAFAQLCAPPAAPAAPIALSVVSNWDEAERARPGLTANPR